MEFDTLVLSRRDLRLLRRVSRKPVANNLEWAKKLGSLVDYGFVTIENFPSDDNTLVPMLTISDEGKQYLLYISRRQNELRFTNALSIIAILISLLALFRTA